MYCSRCGKEIDYDARFCVECAKELAYESALAASRAQEAKAAEDKVEEIAVSVEPASEPIPQSEPVSCEPSAMVVPCAHTHKTESAPSNATPGDMKFGLANSIISLVLAEIASIFMLIAINVAITAPGSGLAVLMLMLPLSIVGLVLGIKSVKVANERARDGYRKPIPTLVLGIIGLVSSALALFCFIIYFFIIVSLISLLG